MYGRLLDYVFNSVKVSWLFISVVSRLPFDVWVCLAYMMICMYSEVYLYMMYAFFFSMYMMYASFCGYVYDVCIFLFMSKMFTIVNSMTMYNV